MVSGKSPTHASVFELCSILYGLPRTSVSMQYLFLPMMLQKSQSFFIKIKFQRSKEKSEDLTNATDGVGKVIKVAAPIPI